jgi:hypothetical protein
MRHLRRLTLWGAAAAATLFLAVLSTRSEVGAQRIAAFSSPRSARIHPFDAQAETRRLASAVQDLTTEDGELKSRLALVERNMNDITGSVTRQIEEAQTTWPSAATPGPLTPAIIASIANPAAPAPAALAAPLPSPALTVPPQSHASGTTPTEYGADIGSALSVQVLRARWLGVHSAHAQVFQGLSPTVVLQETAQAKRVELHLVVGPLADEAGAARLCAKLALYRLSCRPTVFAPPHIALE